MKIGHRTAGIAARLAPVLVVAGAWLALALMGGTAGPPGSAEAGVEEGSGVAGRGAGSICGDGLALSVLPGLAGPLMDLAMAGAMMLPCALPAWFRLFVLGDWRAAYAILLGHGALWAGIALGAAAIEAAGLGLPRGVPVVAELAIATLLVRIRSARRDRADTGAPVDEAATPARRWAGAGFAHGLACLPLDALPMAAAALGPRLAPAGTDLHLCAMLGAMAAMLALRALVAEPWTLRAASAGPARNSASCGRPALAGRRPAQGIHRTVDCRPPSFLRR